MQKKNRDKGETKQNKNLKKLKTCKSPGPDGIHSKVLFETAEQSAPLLEYIYKKSLDEGKLPSTLF